MAGADEPQDGQGSDLPSDPLSTVMSSDGVAVAAPENGSTAGALDDVAAVSLNGHQPGPGELDGVGGTMTLFEHLADSANGCSSAPSPSW